LDLLVRESRHRKESDGCATSWQDHIEKGALSAHPLGACIAQNTSALRNDTQTNNTLGLFAKASEYATIGILDINACPPTGRNQDIAQCWRRREQIDCDNLGKEFLDAVFVNYTTGKM
jgi:hypothetical protein